MGSVKEEVDEHFGLPNGVGLDDRILCDDLFSLGSLPWSDLDYMEDMIDMTKPEAISSPFELDSHVVDDFHIANSTDCAASVNLTNPTEDCYVPKNTQQKIFHVPASKIEELSQESVLIKLLKAPKTGNSEVVGRPQIYNTPAAIQPQLPRQNFAAVPATSIQTVPIQPVQTQTLVISPQPTPPVQICPLYAKVQENQNSTVLTLPSNPTTQVLSPTTQQLTVQQPSQIILSPTPAQSQPSIQLLFDPTIPLTAVPSGGMNTLPEPKNERHRAHNAIEKKYRESINNRIKSLRTLLYGEEAKVGKSGVLGKAIEHIKHLRNINNRLRQENASFKMKLQQMGILNCMKADDTDSVGSVEALTDPLTPESLNDVKSPGSSSPSSPDDSMQTENFPMIDRTRITMCIIMFSFFLFDPFNFIFSWQQGFMKSGESSVPTAHHGRLLMSYGPLDTPQPMLFSKWWFITFIFGPLFRLCAILFIFTKLFVFGEPFLQPDSKIAAKYWRFKRQADLTLEKGDYIECSKVLGRCLEILGRPLPTSRFDMACSLIWHIFRQIVHRLLVTRWLTDKAQQWCSLGSYQKHTEYRKESAKQAALVYHQLHQLYLTGHVPGTQWLAAIVALNAVNMADTADQRLHEESRVDIYIDCAIQLRSTLPRNLKFLARYFLSRARKLCRGQSLTLPYSCWWLFTPVGHRFFVSGEWSCRREEHIWSTSRINDNKPLACVTQKFCEFLLEQAMSALLLSKQHNEYLANSWNPEGNSGCNRALDLLHTMAECVKNSRKSGINRNVKVFGDNTTWPSEEPDLVGCWWAALGKVATCWLLGDVNTAQQQYKSIENIPDEIKNNVDDPLGKALLMAFRARSRLLEKTGRKLENAREILEFCNKGGALLEESLAFSSLRPESNLLNLMHLLCCDWLLSTRADVWEKEKLDVKQHPSQASRLDGFSKDLKSLQKVASCIPDAMSKVYMYQATCRMIADANPMRTQRLLQKSVVHHGCRHGDTLPAAIPECSVSAEKDRANALMLASTHLPASLYSSKAERKEMIIEAMECLQKIGEKERITRCRKLVTSF